MALDVTVSHAFIVLTLVAVAGAVAITVEDVLEDVGDARDERREAERRILLESVATPSHSYDPATEVLTLQVSNDGKVPMDPSLATLVLDGLIVPSFTVSIGGRVSPEVWLPGEVAKFDVADRDGAPLRILVLTPIGVGSTTVLPEGPLATVAVLPDPVSVEIETTQDFEARGYDANWHRITGLTFTWTTTAGTIASTGADTARLTAQSTPESDLGVTASADGVSGSAVVNVVAEPPPP